MLVRASEVDLALGGQRLRSHHDALHRIAGHVRGGAEHERGQHGGHRDDAVALIVVGGARDVSLRDVRDLVRQDARELAFGVARENQPRIHANVAARQRERVDAVVLDDEEIEVEIAVVDVGCQLRAEIAHVLGQEGIVDHNAGVAQLQHDAAADLRLAALADRGVCGAAEIRQLRRLRRQSQRRGQQRHPGFHDPATSLCFTRAPMVLSTVRHAVRSRQRLGCRREYVGNMAVHLDLAPLLPQDAIGVHQEGAALDAEHLLAVHVLLLDHVE